MDVRLGLWRKMSTEKLMLLNCGVGEDSWESLELQGDPTNWSSRKSVLNIHWKDWYWSWNSIILATWYEELIHWKRPWCWERLKAGGQGDDRGWDSQMASPTRWTWVWVSSGSWWWTERHGVLQSMGSQRVGHYWATELSRAGTSVPLAEWRDGLHEINYRERSTIWESFQAQLPALQGQWCTNREEMRGPLPLRGKFELSNLAIPGSVHSPRSSFWLLCHQ